MSNSLQMTYGKKYMKGIKISDAVYPYNVKNVLYLEGVGTVFHIQ